MSADAENLLEAHIHDFLEANIALLLDPGAKVLVREAALPFGRIDLLCEDAAGDLVAVEVKRGVVGREAIGQILAYLGGLREQHPMKHVRGVLVGAALDSAAAAALKAVPDVDFCSYAIAFTLTRVHTGTSTKAERGLPKGAKDGKIGIRNTFRSFGELEHFRLSGPVAEGLSAADAFQRVSDWAFSHDFDWHSNPLPESPYGAISVAAENARGATIRFVLRSDTIELVMGRLPSVIRSLTLSERKELAWIRA